MGSLHVCVILRLSPFVRVCQRPISPWVPPVSVASLESGNLSAWREREDYAVWFIREELKHALDLFYKDFAIPDFM